MEETKSDLVKKLQEINLKISKNIELSGLELQTLLLSSLWSEESNERS